MARFLSLVKEDGSLDPRIWHWTPELEKDPRMREVFPEKTKKKAAAIAAMTEEEKKAQILYQARSTSFGEFDIVKITPPIDEEDEAVEEVIDHITGKEAALARVEELNYPAGRSKMNTETAPESTEISQQERISVIEDAIASLPEESWSKGPLPYPKVPEVSALVGFKVSFQEIKAIVEAMKATSGEPAEAGE